MKFIVPLQGGFDGCSPSKELCVGQNITAANTMGFNPSKVLYNEYIQALDILANKDQIDINLIVLPGITINEHNTVAAHAVDVCENRGDCFVVLDPGKKGTSISGAISAIQQYDTNYSGVYYPWCQINDPVYNRLIWVPPSVPMAGAYSQNDRLGFEWYAVAGLTRGSLPNVTNVQIKLNHGQRDELYQARINPIASYPGQGFSAWGQKTLQRKSSALDRINVRRLLINLKKYVASSGRYIVFQQNVQDTRIRFLNMLNPYFSMVQQQRGIYSYRIVMDETNNTPEIIDRNILKGDI